MCARECSRESEVLMLCAERPGSFRCGSGPRFKSSVLLTKDRSLQLHARLKRKFRKVATHRHTHAAETKQDGSVGRRAHGCGEGTGEGLGIGTCVGMGMGNDKVGRGVGNGVGCEGGQDMARAQFTIKTPRTVIAGHPRP